LVGPKVTFHRNTIELLEVFEIAKDTAM